jgi:hemerythrin
MADRSHTQMSPAFEPIAWSEDMATGIPAIDGQHRYLVEMLSEANTKLLDSNDMQMLARIARDLLGYALLHFETEEALMNRYGFASAFPKEASAHVAQHRAFSREVVAVCDALREGNHVSRLEVLAFLNNWLRDHVLGIDRRLAAFIAEASTAGRDGSPTDRQPGASRRFNQ